MGADDLSVDPSGATLTRLADIAPGRDTARRGAEHELRSPVSDGGAGACPRAHGGSPSSCWYPWAVPSSLIEVRNSSTRDEEAAIMNAVHDLYREIVERLEAVGIPRDGVSVLLRESPPENWGLDGGRAACDDDLGFRIDV